MTVSKGVNDFRRSQHGLLPLINLFRDPRNGLAVIVVLGLLSSLAAGSGLGRIWYVRVSTRYPTIYARDFHCPRCFTRKSVLHIINCALESEVSPYAVIGHERSPTSDRLLARPT